MYQKRIEQAFVHCRISNRASCYWLVQLRHSWEMPSSPPDEPDLAEFKPDKPCQETNDISTRETALRLKLAARENGSTEAKNLRVFVLSIPGAAVLATAKSLA